MSRSVIDIRLIWLFCVLGLFPVPWANVAADDSKTAAFVWGINLNGPEVTIDGRRWEGKNSPNYSCNGKAFDNQSVPLKPPTDSARATMIRSSRWGGDIDVVLKNLSDGPHQIAIYVWEDNNSETYRVLLNDRVVVDSHQSGGAGSWKRLGPWNIDVMGGSVTASARGGAANFSGVEVWSGKGTVPEPKPPEFAAAPTDEQLAFFENKIRPLLVERCYECHSATSKELAANLLLDSRPGIARGGNSGPVIVPGEPEISLLINAISHKNPDLKMPPDKRLSDEEISDLTQWVTQKAPDPRTTNTIVPRKPFEIEAARKRWPFAPVVDPPVPNVRDAMWPINDVDRFIRAAQESKGLAPAGDADRRTLIRRATFDLIGLPPTPAEIHAFVSDPADLPNAFAKVVDRLLESPHYGERWGRHWLDVVRYADTAGDNSDYPIPQMFKYRDWVIDAFNRDLPYDQFIREQLAGDLLESDERRNQRIIATGYIALARRFGSRVDDYPQHLTIEDTIDNVGRTFLGLSLSCARCHDHKFDPISTEDYYGLYGIFHSTRYPWPGIELEKKQRDLVPLVSQAEYDRIVNERAEAIKPLAKEVKQAEAELKRLQTEAPNDATKIAEQKKLIDEAKKKRDTLEKEPLPVEMAFAVADAATREDARVQIKGNPEKPGVLVPRRFLSVLGEQTLSPDERSSGRRQLAEWIASPDNPLTARVMVNRIWHHHFGRGLVPTPNDFGKQGRPATNPELLDWLSHRFVDSGWSVKAMHRLMMNSRTYQLASETPQIARRASEGFGSDPNPRTESQTEPSPRLRVGLVEYVETDPDNDLLTHFRRRRLDAESLRDTLLVLSGHLERGPNGPHPFPPQRDWNFTQHLPFKAVYESNHRTVYLMTQRIQRHPYLAIFDGADTSASTSARGASTTTLQALYLLNDKFVHECAAGFAGRLEQAASNQSDRLDLAYQQALGRPITSAERTAAETFLSQSRQHLASASVPAEQQDLLAWQSYIRAIFRLNEFVYVE